MWDARGSRPLLHNTDIEFHQRMTFSRDGRFFACSTAGSEVYLWKESSTGYTLHGKLASSSRRCTPLLSPNGESIITFGGSTVQLWHTKSLTTPSPSTSTPAPQNTWNFVLDFLPSRSLAVVARQMDHTVVLLDLESGFPWLTIDAGMEVYDLRAFGSAVAVIGDGKVIAWNLQEGEPPPGRRITVEGSAQTMNFGDRQKDHVTASSISPDLLYIAVATQDIVGYQHLEVYSALTGQSLGCISNHGTTTALLRRYLTVLGNATWFAPDGRDIWWIVDGKKAQVWTVTATLDNLRHKMTVPNIGDGSWGCPWGSSRGYKVTKHGWILGPDGKRVFMLPPPWQSYAVQRVWNEKFLALLHGGQLEPVILDLEP